MKRMTAFIGAGALLASSFILVTASPATAANAAPEVVPRIAQWTGGTGVHTLTSASRIIIDPAEAASTGVVALAPGQANRTLAQIAATFAADLAVETGLTLAVVPSASSASGDIVLNLGADAGLGKEGYEAATTDRTVVTAQTTTGIHWGGRTLLQQVRLDAGHNDLSKGTARDVPSQGMRLMMLDLGRRYMPPAAIKDVIRQMSWMKLNTLNLHLGEAEALRLNSPAYPGLADPATSYTEAEIADLVAFAKTLHVSLMPGFEFPGHATVVSDYFDIGSGDGVNPCGPQHMHSHLTPNFVIDLTSATALAKVREMVTEFSSWFDSPYVHIGGDEIPTSLANCPRVSNYIAADPGLSTLGDLLNRWINDLDTTIKAGGKTTMVFNGFEHLGAPQQQVSSDVAVMVWEGDGSAGSLAPYKKVIVGPYNKLFLTPNNYHNLYPDQGWIYDSWTPSSSSTVLGSGLPIWFDYNFSAEERFVEPIAAHPRAILADRTWNASTTPDGVSQFRTRVDALGRAPGSASLAAPARTNNGLPSHRYDFNSGAYPVSHHAASTPGQTLWVADSAGTLHGSSYILNSPSVVGGIMGNAFQFDSSADGVGFGGADVAAPWTASFWVNRTANESDATLFSSSAGALKLEQWNTASKVGFTKNGVADYNFDYSAPLNTWTNITFVASPTATTLYVNGAVHSTINASIPLPMASIGRVGKTLHGALDEVTLYDETLSAAQVATLYNSVATQPVPQPVNRWTFNEGSGVQAADSVGGASAATLQNGAAWIAGPQGNTAVRLDGVDDFVALNLPDRTGNWSMVTWVRRTADKSSASLLASTGSSIKSEQWNNTRNIGVTQFGAFDATSSYSLPLNTWVKLAIVRTSGQTVVYANGAQVATIGSAIDLPLSWLGRRSTSAPSDAAAVDVDDLRVYSAALTAAQVSALP